MPNRTVKIVVEVISPKGAKVAKDAIKDVEGEAVRSTKRAANAQEKAEKEVQRIRNQTRKDGERNDRLLEQSAKRLADVRTREARRSANDFIRSLREMDAAQDRLNRGSSSVGRSAFAGGFLGGITGAALAGTTSALREGASALYDYQNNVEAVALSFTTLTGNAGKAQKFLRDLQAFAKTTPFQFLDLAPIAQRLLGANVQLEKVIPLMRDLGNITAATGKVSSERLEGIGVALTQIISKGKVSAEEMEQLAERGIPAWNILAQAIGKSVAETRKLSEDGRISADVIVAALSKVSRERYGDAMAKQSQIAAVSFSKIKEVILLTASTAFQPFYKEISVMAARMRRDIQAKQGDFRGIGEVIAKYIGEGLGTGISKVLTMFGNYVGTRLKEIFTQGKIVDPITQALFGGLSRGITDGLGITTSETVTKPPSTIDYSRPGDYKANAPITLLPDDKDEKKRQKEREAIIKADLAAQITLYENQLQEIEQKYKESFGKLEDYIKQGGSTEAFQQVFGQLKAWYGEQINTLVPLWEKLVEQQTLKEKKGTNERLLAYTEAQKKKEELTKTTFDLDDRANKLLIEAQKDSLNQRVKLSEEAAQRQIAIEKSSTETQIQLLELNFKSALITEEQYLKSKQALQLSALQYEKDRLGEVLNEVKGNGEKEIAIKQEILLLIEKIRQTEVEGAIEVTEYSKRKAEEEKRASEKRLDDAEKLAKKQQDELEDFQQKQREVFDDTKSWFEQLFESASGGWKGMLDFMLSELKRFAISAAATLVTSKLFGGQGGGFNLGSIFGGGQSGGGIGSIFGNIFGGGASPGGTPVFNPNAGSGIGSLFGGGSGSGIGSTIGRVLGLGSIFGGGSSALGGTLAHEGAHAAAGGAGGIGSMLGSLGGLFTNPYTAIPIIAAIGGFALFKLLKRGGAEKRLKKAAMSEFQIDVKDKGVLKSLKAIGESQFGKGSIKNDQVAKDTVHLEPSVETLRNYAESTGQRGNDKLNESLLGDENYKENVVRSKFSGYREYGGNVSAGRAYIVGERRPELFIPNTSGYIAPSVPNNKAIEQKLDQLIRVMSVVAQSGDISAEVLSQLRAVSPGQVLAIGANQNPAVFETGVSTALQNAGGRGTEKINRGLGNTF